MATISSGPPASTRRVSLPANPGRAARALGLGLLLLALATPVPARAGTIVDARCPCGYHTGRLLVFGGRADFKTVCMFPALCRDTDALLLVNLLDPATPPAGCPGGSAIPYDHPALAPAPGGRVVASWRLPGQADVAAVLYDGGYLCPRCRKKTLRFSQVGFWD